MDTPPFKRFIIPSLFIDCVQADLERQQTEIKGKVMEEIFRLCKNLLQLENFDISLHGIRNILSRWFAFDGNNIRGNCGGNNDSMEEPRASALLDGISQLSDLIDEASNICQSHDFACYNFGKYEDKVCSDEID